MFDKPEVQPDNRPTIDNPDDDPYLWLEDINGERALAWAQQQTTETLERYATPDQTSDRDMLAALFDRPDKVPGIGRLGGFVYNVWKDATHPRGLWRRTTLESYRSEHPAWDELLDLDALAAADSEDWVFHGAALEPGPAERERAIITLSRGGSDAVVNREYDLVARTFVPGGFEVPEAKGGLSWLDRDTVLLISTHGENMATRSGYPRSVRLWHRGSGLAEAKIIFEVDAVSLAASGGRDSSVDGERLLFSNHRSFFQTEYWIGDRSGPRQKLELPADAGISIHKNWLVVNLREPWTIDGVTWPGDSLIVTLLTKFLDGHSRFELLFAPQERRVCDGYFWNRGNLVLSILDNLINYYEVLVPGNGEWRRIPIDTLPQHGIVQIGPLDADDKETNGDILVAVQDPITPAQLLLSNIAEPDNIAVPALLKTSPEGFNPRGLVVTRHEAVSVDGVRIPYTQVGPAALTGDAPVHLTGYGGFGIALQAGYDVSIGKLWLERGGTHVLANIRGGGEFGVPWHEAGRREGKKLSHDDFAAIAADLVDRGVTRPSRIAAEGGSNGGLLIANMLTRYPERFGALLCTVPVIDLRRFSKLLAGASWIDEFGDPDKAEDWAYMQHISAYHVASAGNTYPPILITSSLKDDRVHPGHARKMAAKLQHLGYPAYYYEQATGGHGAGKDNKEVANFITLGFSFLRNAIGWTG